MDAVFGMFIPWGGNMGGGRPDNSLPGGPPAHPWFPGHGGQPHPGHGLPQPPGGPSTQPIPLPPGQGYPPGVNPPIVPPDAPPGSIWPPLPPGSHIPAGKAIVVILASDGYHYAVVEVAQPK